MKEMSEDKLLLRNLKDAGCDDAAIEQYFKLKQAGKVNEQLRLLSVHRTSLLDKVHASQQMIDCLDYLMYSMKKQ